MRLVRSLIFGWSDLFLSSLVPGTLGFGGGGGGGTTVVQPKAAPPAAPAPGTASAPTQTVTQILTGRTLRRTPSSTIMTGSSAQASASTARRTILGIPIV